MRLLLFVVCVTFSGPAGAKESDYVQAASLLCGAVDEARAGEWLIVELDQLLPALSEARLSSCLSHNIRMAQKRGVSVFAVTARPAELAGRALSELSLYGIDFEQSPLPSALFSQLRFSNRDGRLVRYQHGMFFVGGNNSKDVIRAIIASAIHSPTRVRLLEEVVGQWTVLEYTNSPPFAASQLPDASKDTLSDHCRHALGDGSVKSTLVTF